jgi:acyl carrier protein
MVDTEISHKDVNMHEQVIALIKENFLAEQENSLAEIGIEEPLFTGNILDSLDLVALIPLLEETFQIKIKNEDLLPENFDTIANIVSYLESKT